MTLSFIALLAYIEYGHELPTWLWLLSAAEMAGNAIFKRIDAYLAKRPE